MKTRNLYSIIFTSALFATGLMAQSSPTVFGQVSYTTPIVGFTQGQTARLSALNLTPSVLAPTSFTATSSCTVQMQFVDDTNTPLAQAVKAVIPSQTAHSMDQTWAVSPVAASSVVSSMRRQVRGVVTVTPNLSAAAAGSTCNIKVSLEIFDFNGNTVVFTSDTTVVPSLVATPVALQ